MNSTFDAVNERLPAGKLFTLGLQHVLVMYAGLIAMLIAPLFSRMLRFFPSVVTGTISLVIGVTLMRKGIHWIFGLPVGPASPQIVGPDQIAWLNEVKLLADARDAAMAAEGGH